MADKRDIFIISVVRDFGMYERCVGKDNAHTKGCTLFPIDNRVANEGVPAGYNRFLASRPKDEDAWYVFCHEDFEFLESPAEVLRKLEAKLGDAAQQALWGPIGATTRVRFGLYHQWLLLGQVQECRKDGTNRRSVGVAVPTGTPVETFDCQCLIVHSSLVRKHHLRFDEHLTFDLYAEEFCMAASETAGIPARILSCNACHWSGGSVQMRYYTQEAYVNAKYPAACYTGSSSWILGGHPPLGRKLTVATKKTVRLLVGLFSRKMTSD